MRTEFEDYCKRLDQKVDLVRHVSKPFRETLGLTGFCYVRVYHDGRTGWATTDADHDRFLLETIALEEDPLIDMATLLKEGHYLWFHNRQFLGCESFYQDRERLFEIDHGLVIVKHQKNYLETACFSGKLSKQPLYNLFMQELGLFRSFLNHFSSNLNPSLLPLLEEGLHLDDIKKSDSTNSLTELSEKKRKHLIQHIHPQLLKLSQRERQCLSLLKNHLTYEDIASKLQLSPRTVEHYLISVKNKLNLETRSQLFVAAQQLSELGFF